MAGTGAGRRARVSSGSARACPFDGGTTRASGERRERREKKKRGSPSAHTSFRPPGPHTPAHQSPPRPPPLSWRTTRRAPPRLGSWVRPCSASSRRPRGAVCAWAGARARRAPPSLSRSLRTPSRHTPPSEPPRQQQRQQRLANRWPWGRPGGRWPLHQPPGTARRPGARHAPARARLDLHPNPRPPALGGGYDRRRRPTPGAGAGRPQAPARRRQGGPARRSLPLSPTPAIHPTRWPRRPPVGRL